jgi:hypothetical protein
MNFDNQLSITIIPFQIINKDENNNPFDFQVIDAAHCNDHSRQFFIGEIEKITIPDNIIDSKYHEYIHNHISKGKDGRDCAFLKTYRIDQNSFETTVSNFPYHPQKHVLRVGENWTVSFLDHSYVVINEYAGMGYFVFGVKFQGDEGTTIEDFEQCEFFRYFTNKNSNKKNDFKYAMHVHARNSLSERLDHISFEDVIRAMFSSVIPFFKLRYERPILLHLMHSKDSSALNSTRVETLFYNVLRIQPKGSQMNLNTQGNIVDTTIAGVSICTLNEGACILDPSVNETAGLFKKYFPAFLLVLNQREIMLQMNHALSSNRIEELNRASQELINKLEKLKKRIEFYQFKQIFYSVSFNDELVLFYDKLQKAFNIQVLLNDNKESVREIYTLLEDNSQNKRDKWVNGTLGAIGCLGAFSYFKDLFPFISDNQPVEYLGQLSVYFKFFAALCPFIVFLMLWRLMRK